MEELLNQLKFRLKIEDKNGVIWYDFFTLLAFIAKYFPKLSDNKGLEMHVEWYSYDIIELSVMDWSGEDLDDPTPAIEITIDFSGFHDIPYGAGKAQGMSDEVELESHLDKLLSANIPGLRDFLMEYIPMTQLIYYSWFGENGDERIYSTDLGMLTLLTGETDYECELIL